MALSELKKRANKLKIAYDENTSDARLEELCRLEEDKIEQEKKEQEIEEENKKKLAANKSKVLLKNIFLEDVDQKDYFMGGKDKDGKMIYAHPWFNDVCGLPVDREDMIEVFKKVFGGAAADLLFYKVKNQEVYIVIVPLSKSTVVGPHEDSMQGDFQKHAISFISDGSVNLDTLKLKLRKIAQFLKRAD